MPLPTLLLTIKSSWSCSLFPRRFWAFGCRLFWLFSTFRFENICCANTNVNMLCFYDLICVFCMVITLLPQTVLYLMHTTVCESREFLVERSLTVICCWQSGNLSVCFFRLHHFAPCRDYLQLITLVSPTSNEIDVHFVLCLSFCTYILQPTKYIQFLSTC